MMRRYINLVEQAEIDFDKSVLTPDLLKPEYRAANTTNPTLGHCYAATEALYHLLGGHNSDWQPVRGKYASLKSKAPPVLARRMSRGWKLVEGGHRVAAAIQRGDASIPVVDVSAFFAMTKDCWMNL